MHTHTHTRAGLGRGHMCRSRGGKWLLCMHTCVHICVHDYRSLWVQPTADSQQPSTNLTTTPVPATTQQPSPQQQSVWASALKEVDYVAGQVGAFDQPSKGVTGPGCGRVGTVSFGRGGPPPPAIAAQTGNKPGSVTPSQTSVTHNGRARGTLWRYQGVEGSVGFGYDTVRELRAAKAAMSELDAAKESNKGSFSMGECCMCVCVCVCVRVSHPACL